MLVQEDIGNHQGDAYADPEDETSQKRGTMTMVLIIAVVTITILALGYACRQKEKVNRSGSDDCAIIGPDSWVLQWEGTGGHSVWQPRTPRWLQNIVGCTFLAIVVAGLYFAWSSPSWTCKAAILGGGALSYILPTAWDSWSCAYPKDMTEVISLRNDNGRYYQLEGGSVTPPIDFIADDKGNGRGYFSGTGEYASSRYWEDLRRESKSPPSKPKYIGALVDAKRGASEVTYTVADGREEFSNSRFEGIIQNSTFGAKYTIRVKSYTTMQTGVQTVSLYTCELVKKFTFFSDKYYTITRDRPHRIVGCVRLWTDNYLGYRHMRVCAGKGGLPETPAVPADYRGKSSPLPTLGYLASLMIHQEEKMRLFTWALPDWLC